MGSLCSTALLKTPEYEPFHLQIEFVPERQFFVAFCGRRLDAKRPCKGHDAEYALKFHNVLH